jgi:hypothetical protein
LDAGLLVVGDAIAMRGPFDMAAVPLMSLMLARCRMGPGGYLHRERGSKDG